MGQGFAIPQRPEADMRKAARGLVPYLVAAIALSSIDITYEWLSPLPPGGA
jgi:hypothetical protein